MYDFTGFLVPLILSRTHKSVGSDVDLEISTRVYSEACLCLCHPRSLFIWDHPTHLTMSSGDIAEEIRTHLPGTEEIIVQYLSGYLVDDAGEDEDVLAVAREILASASRGNTDALEKVMQSLSELLADTLKAREANKAKPTLTKLEKVVDMSRAGAMSSTIAFTEGVDLESINKGKQVAPHFACS
jgi:hypothetical protein